jgi:tetratricopeptide (TPR) repeat protein
LYCPSCDQSFGESLSRCPECHCWLKPSVKAEADADAGQSGWLGSSSSDSEDQSGWLVASSSDITGKDGWKTPKDSPEQSGWGSTDAAPKHSGGRRSVAEEPNEEFGWHYQEPASSSQEEVREQDAWVDEEFSHGYDYEEEDYLDRAPTQRVDLAEEVEWNPLRGFLVVAITLVLLSLVYLQVGKGQDQVSPEEFSRNENLQSAEIWLKSARESVDKSQFEEASLQYKQAVEYLVEGGADQEQIVRARVEYSDALIEQGDYLSAHEQIFQISSNISDGDERLAWVEEELVRESTEQLGEARGLLSSQPEESVRLAEDSLEVFLIFNASNASVAQAYDVSARAYLNLDQVTAAAESVKDAMRWESSPERLALYVQLFPSAPPPKAKPKRNRRTKVQVSLGEASEIPHGKKGKRRYKSRQKPVVVVSKPKQKPPEHKPNYDKFRQKQKKRLGHNPLTDN